MSDIATLEARIKALEARVDHIDKRNSENRELIISMRSELEEVRDMVRLQASKADSILAQVESISSLQNSLERNIINIFDRLEGRLKSIQAAVEAGSKPIPFGG